MMEFKIKYQQQIKRLNKKQNSFTQQIPNLSGYHMINYLMSIAKKQPFTYQIFIQNYYYIATKLKKIYPQQKQKIENYQPFQTIFLDKLLPILQEQLNVNIVQFIFGFSKLYKQLEIIQSSQQKLERLNQKCKQLRQKNNFQLFVILRVPIHWSLLHYKKQNNIISFLFYDSMFPYDLIKTKNIKQLIKYKDNQLNISTFISFINDLLQSFQIINGMIQGTIYYKERKLINICQKILNDFKQNVYIQQDFINWLQQQYNPLFIQSLLNPKGANYHSQKSRQILSDLLTLASQFKILDLPIVKLFYQTIENII